MDRYPVPEGILRKGDNELLFQMALNPNRFLSEDEIAKAHGNSKMTREQWLRTRTMGIRKVLAPGYQVVTFTDIYTPTNTIVPTMFSGLYDLDILRTCMLVDTEVYPIGAVMYPFATNIGVQLVPEGEGVSSEIINDLLCGSLVQQSRHRELYNYQTKLETILSGGGSSALDVWLTLRHMFTNGREDYMTISRREFLWMRYGSSLYEMSDSDINRQAKLSSAYEGLVQVFSELGGYIPVRVDEAGREYTIFDTVRSKIVRIDLIRT